MLGMLYTRLGNALQFNHEIREAHQYATKALHLGEEIGSQEIIGYSLAVLCYTFRELGLLEEAISHGEKVRDSMHLFHTDSYLSRFLLAGLGFAYMFTGDVKKCRETGDYLVNKGTAENDRRKLSVGFRNIATSYWVAGDLAAMIEYCQKAIQACPEPLFVGGAKAFLATACLATGNHKEAEEIFSELLKFDKEFGFGFMGTWAKPLWGVITLLRGDLNKGIGIIEDAIQAFREKGSRYRYAYSNHTLGRIYLQIAQGGGGKKDLSFYGKNIGFLIKTVPFAHKKAEEHFTMAIETAKEIGAKGLLAQAYLDMGRLRQTKGKTDEARKYISDAIQLFEECEADVFLKHASDALAALS